MRSELGARLCAQGQSVWTTINGRSSRCVLFAVRVDGGKRNTGWHLGEMHFGGFALGHRTHARVANAACSAASHQYGLLQSAMELNMSAFEATNNAFTVSLKMENSGRR